MRARTALIAVIATGCLAAAGCSGDSEGGEPGAAPTSAPTSAETPAEPATEPLTGLDVRAGGDAARRYPVLVLKMDNTASSAPQLGLSSADLVVEELVEGGVTRLAAFYYSDIPGDVGPVRSMRASDIGIVSPVDATMVTSGAATVTISRLKAAGIDFVTEGSPGFFRESSRIAPYNLMTSLTDVAKATQQRPARPVDYLPFGTEDELPTGRQVKGFDAVFSGGHTTTWSYRTGGYVNENTFAATGDEFPADSVLVLRVKVGDAGYRDPAGNPVPETLLEGQGAAMLFHGGRLVRGTWSKAALDAPLELATKGGDADGPGRAHLDRAGAGLRREASRWTGEAGHAQPGASGSPVGIATPWSARDWKPAMMKPIATSTRSAAAMPSSAPATDSPADDIAPKKIRAKVCTISSSSSQSPATSTARRMSTTLAKVDRSSCSR